MPAMPSSGCAADPPWSAPSGNRPNSFHCNYIMQGSIDLAIFRRSAATVGSVLRPQKPAPVGLRLF
jgi:hypothetical protein